MAELTLYHMTTCPYCVRVFDAIDRLGVELEMRDVRTEPGARDELIRIGGKGQVPCLVIDGKPLYESLDIVAWLEGNC